jgi:pimeloyl-ACP methyl ester carboxylesterase
MSHHVEPNAIEQVDDALAALRQAGIPAHTWAYLAAEAVRWLNRTTIDSGGYVYPGDIYSTIGNLETLLQRLPQALRQAARALQAIDDAGHVVDVDQPDRTAVSVATVTESLADAASHCEAAARELASAQVPAGRLAYREHTEAGER